MMTREERLLMKPNYTMVYHKDLGISMQMVLKDIVDNDKYIFYNFEDIALTSDEVEDFLEIAQY